MFLQAGQFGIFPAKLLRGMDAAAQILLAWLWFHKNNEGKCWPSIKTLEQETSLTGRTIQKKLLFLEEKGLIKRYPRKRRDGSSTSNMYEMIVDTDVLISGGGVPMTGGAGSLGRGIDQKSKRTKIKTVLITNAEDHSADAVVESVDSTNHVDLVSKEENKQISEIIHTLREHNKALGFNQSPQRNAALKLIREKGFERALRAARLAVVVLGADYAPTIASPIQLWNNHHKLVAFLKKNPEYYARCEVRYPTVSSTPDTEETS